ncbi:MAG: response regulator transcription factor [Elusimicrobia bacterium]|nr:response regulator transcription factor [Elusimicrobiota bacterium]MBU2614129.1 response regulator transcription factor [Elusimicrobiota bacterium]
MEKTGTLIAVVDDEQDILELLSLNLKKAGYKVKEFSDSKSFFKSIENQKPSLIILDIMLPDMDGYEICKQLKSSSKFVSVPIIMLTAKSEEFDKVLGLELGADDYITKPFSPREFVARVKAVLRRNTVKEDKEDLKNITFGDILVINPEKYEVIVKGKRIDLTTTEFKILEILASRKGFVFSRDKLLDNLWGQEKAVLDRTIDVHIKNLREKLRDAGKLIKNIRGVGYKLEL